MIAALPEDLFIVCYTSGPLVVLRPVSPAGICAIKVFFKRESKTLTITAKQEASRQGRNLLG